MRSPSPFSFERSITFARPFQSQPDRLGWGGLDNSARSPSVPPSFFFSPPVLFKDRLRVARANHFLFPPLSSSARNIPAHRQSLFSPDSFIIHHHRIFFPLSPGGIEPRVTLHG